MQWSSLLPLAGVILGSGLTLYGQALTDSRAVRRDELTAQRSAEAQAKVDWAIIQRQTIAEIQDTLELVAATHVVHGSGQRLRSSMAEEAAQTSRRLFGRLARLENRTLAADITAWLDSEQQTVISMTMAMRGLQERLGIELRRTHTG